MNHRYSSVLNWFLGLGPRTGWTLQVKALSLPRQGRLQRTSKLPEGDLAPSRGHGQHCSSINPRLLYYFQIIFKWLKSLCSIKSLSLIPLHLPISLHFNGGRAILSGWGQQRLRPLLEGGLPQDTVRTLTQGRDNKHEAKSLKRTWRQMKGFGLSGGDKS